MITHLHRFLQPMINVAFCCGPICHIKDMTLTSCIPVNYTESNDNELLLEYRRKVYEKYINLKLKSCSAEDTDGWAKVYTGTIHETGINKDIYIINGSTSQSIFARHCFVSQTSFQIPGFSDSRMYITFIH